MFFVVGFWVQAVDLSAQCSIGSFYYRNLTGNSYTWSWDGETNAANISGGGKTDIRGYMRQAVNQWVSAANSAGYVINITEVTSGGNIVFLFEDIPNDGSGTIYGWSDPGTKLIKLNSKIDIPWTLNTWEVPQRVDLVTTIVHELGHIFLGGGHTSMGGSIMRELPPTVYQRSLNYCDEATTRDLYNPKKFVTLVNSFGGGGTMKIDGSIYNIPTDGLLLEWRSSSFPHTIEAVDNQNASGYVQEFRKWIMAEDENVSNPLIVELFIGSSATYKAIFDPTYSITFKNNFPGVGNAGQMKIGGITYSLPVSPFQVVENNTIIGEALSQIYNGIQYTFSQWHDGNTSNPRTFLPSDHSTYTAAYTGKPVQVNITSTSGAAGTNITIQWQSHPNPNVTYEVWRKVKNKNGTWNGPTLKATLSHGTTSWTDYEYTYTNGYTDDLLMYDIREYYSTEDVYADEDWITIYGTGGLMKSAESDGTQQGFSATYSLGNYPNPFNPETNIVFDLTRSADVTLAVYNIRGQQVALLVKAKLQAGNYRYSWAGTSNSGVQLPTGIYLAKLHISPLNGEPKQVLTHRLMFTK